MGWFRRRPTFKERVLSKLNFIELGMQFSNRKAIQMADELKTLDEAIAKIEADAVNIAENVEATRDEVMARQAQVAELQLQIDAGTPATAEQLAELSDRVNAVDVALDAIVPDAPVEPPVEVPVE